MTGERAHRFNPHLSIAVVERAEQRRCRSLLAAGRDQADGPQADLAVVVVERGQDRGQGGPGAVAAKDLDGGDTYAGIGVAQRPLGERSHRGGQRGGLAQELEPQLPIDGGRARRDDACRGRLRSGRITGADQAAGGVEPHARIGIVQERTQDRRRGVARRCARSRAGVPGPERRPRRGHRSRGRRARRARPPPPRAPPRAAPTPPASRRV